MTHVIASHFERKDVKHICLYIDKNHKMLYHIKTYYSYYINMN